MPSYYYDSFYRGQLRGCGCFGLRQGRRALAVELDLKTTAFLIIALPVLSTLPNRLNSKYLFF